MVGCLGVLSNSPHLVLLSELDGAQLTRGTDLYNEEIITVCDFVICVCFTRVSSASNEGAFHCLKSH